MAALQGKFFDLRMQDVYNIVKCLQDLACATAATALVFVSCGGLSNLAAVLSWPLEGMRHARWAASVVMSDVSPNHPFPQCHTRLCLAEQAVTTPHLSYSGGLMMYSNCRRTLLMTETKVWLLSRIEYCSRGRSISWYSSTGRIVTLALIWRRQLPGRSHWKLVIIGQSRQTASRQSAAW